MVGVFGEFVRPGRSLPRTREDPRTIARMRRWLARMAPILHLTRVSSAFAAVGNVWFVILWTRANNAEVGADFVKTGSLWLVLPAAALAAVGLFAYGVCMNDLLDARRDRAMRPDRPMPSGKVSASTAVTVVAVTLITAVLGAAPFGTEATVLTLALAALIILFNAAAKFVPGIGMVVLGLIYAGHMLVPNVQIRFLWPVWVVLTHCVLVFGVSYALARKTPKISRRAMVVASLGWAFWSGVLLALAWARKEEGAVWPEWVPGTAALWIAVLAGLCVLWCQRRVAATGIGPRAAEKVWRYGALWLTLYGCVWLFAGGHLTEGWILTALAVVGFAGMTFLREWYGLLEEPAGYRR